MLHDTPSIYAPFAEARRYESLEEAAPHVRLRRRLGAGPTRRKVVDLLRRWRPSRAVGVRASALSTSSEVEVGVGVYGRHCRVQHLLLSPGGRRAGAEGGGEGSDKTYIHVHCIHFTHTE